MSRWHYSDSDPEPAQGRLWRDAAISRSCRYTGSTNRGSVSSVNHDVSNQTHINKTLEHTSLCISETIFKKKVFHVYHVPSSNMEEACSQPPGGNKGAVASLLEAFIRWMTWHLAESEAKLDKTKSWCLFVCYSGKLVIWCWYKQGEWLTAVIDSCICVTLLHPPIATWQHLYPW